MNEEKKTYKTDVMDPSWTEEEARERVMKKEAENRGMFKKFGIYILVFFAAIGIVIYKFNS
ncbi:MAG: hypothetical protein IJU59_03515 [Firmicutes bacterium]|nr:hypothetical protein [Bacillota bacterium]